VNRLSAPRINYDGEAEVLMGLDGRECLVRVSDFISNRVDTVSRSIVPIYKVAGFDDYDFAELGVTDQFLSDAETYYEKYTNPVHFKELYARALQVIRVPQRRLNVLDIGTGGGNSVFAIRTLLPDIDVFGVDISQPLLELCSRAAVDRFGVAADRMVLLCADLYALNVVPNSVDLVTGSSILHHMVEPGPIVAKALTALRSGGHAVFTEPFESGHGILRGIYATILAAEARYGEPIPILVHDYMTAFIRDFDARRGIGDVRDYTRHLDDKWYFTTEWFRSLARQYGCDVMIIPTHGSNAIFWHHFVHMARFHNGADANALPDWAKAVFHQMDDSFSRQQLDELPFTGIVVLRKP
jgi:SAM-dependent methyltransferase